MIKWGVMGTSGIAASCTIPGMKQSDNCELYAIAGRNEVKVKQYKENFGFSKAYSDDELCSGYEKLLADPEVCAAYIALPNNLHKEWAVKAMREGKHVLCEKPLALNTAEAEEMFAEAAANNVILMEAYAYLHSPYIVSLINDVKSGMIGDIVYIDTAFLTQGYKEDFRLHKELGGGMVYDLGCYCSTLILSLIDSPVEYIKANAEMTEEGVDSFVGAIVKFENGTRASFNVGMVLGEDTSARYDRLFIHGTRGDIRSEVEYNQQGELSYRIMTANGVITRTVHAESNYTLEVSQLGRAIQGIEPVHITPEFSLRNARFLDAVLEEIGY